MSLRAMPTRRPLLHAFRRLPSATSRHVSSGTQKFMEGDRVLLRHATDPEDTKLTQELSPQLSVSSRNGVLQHSDIIGRQPRDILVTHKNTEFRLSWPTLEEYVTKIVRLVTPVYPLDAATISTLLDIHIDAGASPPLEILEAGTGHGSLTLALARAVHAGNAHLSLEPGLSDEEKRKRRGAVIHSVDNSKKHSKHASQVVRGFRRGMYFDSVDFYVGDPREWLESQLASRGLNGPEGEAMKVQPHPPVKPQEEETAKPQAMKPQKEEACKPQEEEAVKLQEEEASKPAEEEAGKVQEEASKVQGEEAIKVQEEEVVKLQEEEAAKPQEDEIVKPQEDEAHKPQEDEAVKPQEDEVEGREGFLYAIILDLPGPEAYLATAAKALLTDSIVCVFCPSITQIGACVKAIKDQKLPLVQHQVIEFPGSSGVGAGLRTWDVRYARVRAKAQGPLSVLQAENKDGSQDAAQEDELQMVCRPTSFERNVGGGFLGMFKRKARGGEGKGTAKNLKKVKIVEKAVEEAVPATAEEKIEENAEEAAPERDETIAEERIEESAVWKSGITH